MAQARKQESWEHTSAMLSLIANTHRDPKKTKAFSPRDFNPYAHLEEHVERIESLGVLRDQFLRGRTKGE